MLVLLTSSLAVTAVTVALAVSVGAVKEWAFPAESKRAQSAGFSIVLALVGVTIVFVCSYRVLGVTLPLTPFGESTQARVIDRHFSDASRTVNDGWHLYVATPAGPEWVEVDSTLYEAALPGNLVTIRRLPNGAGSAAVEGDFIASRAFSRPLSLVFGASAALGLINTTSTLVSLTRRRAPGTS